MKVVIPNNNSNRKLSNYFISNAYKYHHFQPPELSLGLQIVKLQSAKQKKNTNNERIIPIKSISDQHQKSKEHIALSLDHGVKLPKIKEKRAISIISDDENHLPLRKNYRNFGGAKLYHEKEYQQRGGDLQKGRSIHSYNGKSPNDFLQHEDNGSGSPNMQTIEHNLTRDTIMSSLTKVYDSMTPEILVGHRIDLSKEKEGLIYMNNERQSTKQRNRFLDGLKMIELRKKKLHKLRNVQKQNDQATAISTIINHYDNINSSNNNTDLTNSLENSPKKIIQDDLISKSEIDTFKELIYRHHNNNNASPDLPKIRKNSYIIEHSGHNIYISYNQSSNRKINHNDKSMLNEQNGMNILKYREQQLLMNKLNDLQKLIENQNHNHNNSPKHNKTKSSFINNKNLAGILNPITTSSTIKHNNIQRQLPTTKACTISPHDISPYKRYSAFQEIDRDDEISNIEEYRFHVDGNNDQEYEDEFTLTEYMKNQNDKEHDEKVTQGLKAGYMKKYCVIQSLPALFVFGGIIILSL